MCTLQLFYRAVHSFLRCVRKLPEGLVESATTSKSMSDVNNWGEQEEEGYLYGEVLLHDAAEEGDMDLVGKLLRGISSSVDKKAAEVVDPADVDDSADSDDSAVEEDPDAMDDSAPDEDDDDFDLHLADVDINARDRWRITPVYAALLGCQFSALEALLEKKPRLTMTVEVSSLLHFACAIGGMKKNREFSAKAVELLLSSGAPIVLNDDLGRTPVHIAVMYGLEENIKLLLAAGKDLNMLSSTDRYGWTPLHTAAAYRRIKVVRLILSYPEGKASVNSQDLHGRTPLHVAMENGCVDMLQLLIDHGGNQSLLDKRQRTATMAAEEHGFTVDDAKSIRPPTLVVYHGDYCKHLTAKTIKRAAPEPPPENVQRVKVLCNEDNGLLRASEFEDVVRFDESPPMANIVDVVRVHDFVYVRKLNQLCNEIKGPDTISELDPDTAICSESFKVALRAAGAVTHAIDRVMKGDVQNAFCVVRPPGHHAGPRGVVTCGNDPCGSHGFCLLNNVAIGAGYAKCAYRNQGIQKVAILDFDVHHGNGTEACIQNLVPNQLISKKHLPGVGEMIVSTPSYKPWLNEDDPENIFFCSVHGYGQRDAGPGWFYPGSGETSATSARGEECNEKRIFNFGIEFMTDKDALSYEWRRTWRQEVFPALERFNPDLILISAGFDAHRRDILNHGHVQLEEPDYEWFTRHVVRIANECCEGRVVSVLEGGYRVHGYVVSPFGRSIAGHVRALSAPGLPKDSASLRAYEDVDEAERESARLAKLAAADEAERAEFMARVAAAESHAIASCESGEKAAIPIKNENCEDANLEDDGHSRKRRRVEVDYVALDAQMKAEMTRSE